MTSVWIEGAMNMVVGVLRVMIGIFGVLGTIAFGFGMILTVGSFLEEGAVLSWLGVYAGFALLIVGAVLYIVMLLAYITAILARHVMSPVPGNAPPSHRKSLPQSPNAPWYAQSSNE